MSDYPAIVKVEQPSIEGSIGTAPSPRDPMSFSASMPNMVSSGASIKIIGLPKEVHTLAFLSQIPRLLEGVSESKNDPGPPRTTTLFYSHVGLAEIAMYRSSSFLKEHYGLQLSLITEESRAQDLQAVNSQSVTDRVSLPPNSTPQTLMTSDQHQAQDLQAMNSQTATGQISLPPKGTPQTLMSSDQQCDGAENLIINDSDDDCLIVSARPVLKGADSDFQVPERDATALSPPTMATHEPKAPSANQTRPPNISLVTSSQAPTDPPPWSPITLMSPSGPTLAFKAQTATHTFSRVPIDMAQPSNTQLFSQAETGTHPRPTVARASAHLSNALLSHSVKLATSSKAIAPTTRVKLLNTALSPSIQMATLEPSIAPIAPMQSSNASPSYPAKPATNSRAIACSTLVQPSSTWSSPPAQTATCRNAVAPIAQMQSWNSDLSRLPITVSQQKFLMNGIQSLSQWKEAIFFAQEVTDPQAKLLKVPDYRKRIPVQIHLRNMEEKLKGAQYKNIDEYVAEFNQMVQNSLTVNGVTNRVTKGGFNLLAGFNKQIQSVLSPNFDKGDTVATALRTNGRPRKWRKLEEELPLAKATPRKYEPCTDSDTDGTDKSYVPPKSRRRGSTSPDVSNRRASRGRLSSGSSC